MLILGATPQQKGAQLETLTERLLEHLNYVNCTTNVFSGGAEIDVSGQYRLPQPGRTTFQTLIAECKAHRSPVDMTQWCKFLGKIFFQEACEQQDVLGCFIALSGVTGPVQGHYDALARHRHNVTLIQGDSFLALLQEIVAFGPLRQIDWRVRCLTDRTPSRFEVAYYDGAVYWVVTFTGGDYTLLSADGEPLPERESASLAEMVQLEITCSHFVDLREEARSQERRHLARSLVVASLFVSDGRVEGGIGGLTDIEDFSAEELRTAAQGLVEEGLLSVPEGGPLVIPTTLRAGHTFVNPELYRLLFRVRCPLSVLGCEFYDAHINEAMVREICSIQQGLPLEGENVERAIRLLRLSPTALGHALFPIQMIVQGRQQGIAIELVDRFHVDYFFQVSLEALKRDFRTRLLGEYFHERRGLRELEYETQLRVKNQVQIEDQYQIFERYGVGPAHESVGGGFVQVAMIRDFPQPWERPTGAKDTARHEQQATDT